MWDSPLFLVPLIVVATVVCLVLYLETRRALVIRTRQREAERKRPYYWYLLGLADRNEGKISEAIADFSEALLRDSQFPGTWSSEYRLLALFERGQLWVCKYPPAHEFAAEDFTEAIRVRAQLAPEESGYVDRIPSLGELHHHRARSHAALGMFDEAIEDFTTTIDSLVSWGTESGGRLTGVKDSTGLFYVAVNPYSDRGNLYKESGMYEEAVDNYTEEIDFLSQHIPNAVAGAYHDRALAYLEWGRYGPTLDDLDRAIREYQAIDPEDVPPELIAQREVVLAQLRSLHGASRNV